MFCRQIGFNILQKGKETKMILKKKNKVGGLILPNIKTEATVKKKKKVW